MMHEPAPLSIAILLSEDYWNTKNCFSNDAFKSRIRIADIEVASCQEIRLNGHRSVKISCELVNLGGLYFA